MLALAQTLEWFQCKSCGRRHRWQAEIAGTEIECQCGAHVFCPEIDVFGDADASDTLADSESSTVYVPAGEGSDHFPAEMIALEDEEAGGPAKYQRKRAGGLFGMGPFGEMVFWLIGAAIGFALVVHAIILRWPVYIILTVIWAPISFLKFRKKLRRWQGNRSLMRAIEEQFGD